VKRIAVLCLALGLFLAAPPAPLLARRQGKEQAIRFAKGSAASATYKGRVPKSEYDYDAYLLKRAKAGQVLGFTLESADPAARVVVYAMELGPTEDLIAPAKLGGAPLRKWSGKLPVTGGYSVQVYGKRPGTSYTLKVSLK